MNERNSIDILLDYPKEMGLAYETNESKERFYLSANDPFLDTKYVIFKKDSLIFCAYDSYAVKAFMSKTFTGVYGVLDWNSNFECEVARKDWLDFFVKRTTKKTGIQSIDNKLTITTKSTTNIGKIINQEVAEILLKLDEKISPIEILIKDNYLPIIGEFEGKKIIGVETNQWIYHKDEIDTLITLGEKIINEIKKTPAANIL